MSASRKVTLLSALILLLATGAAYTARLVANQRDELRALRKRHDALAAGLREARQRAAPDAEALAALQRQLDFPPVAAATKSSDNISAQTQAWLAKLATARRLFAAHPEASIPELQLLDLRTWLGAIKDLQFDTDENTRRGLAALRTTAKQQFTDKLCSALQKYLNQHDGQLPPDLLSLRPLFNTPIDATILDRYKLTQTGRLAPDSVPKDPVILEKSPVDEDFDSRRGVQVARMADGSGWGAVGGGFGGSPGPAAWIDGYQARLKRARTDFAQANPGIAPPGLADLAPYLNPPLDPATLQKLLAREPTK